MEERLPSSLGAPSTGGGVSKKAVKGADRGLVPTVRRPVKDYFQGGGLEQ